MSGRRTRTKGVPHNEGTRFVAWSPDVPFFVHGRRSRSGELLVDSMIFNRNGPAPSLQELKDSLVGDVEIVLGPEAEALILPIKQQQEAVRPFFAFYREANTGEIALVGRLFVDMPAREARKKSGQRIIKTIVGTVVEQHRNRGMASYAPLFGWPGDYRPFGADQITNDNAIMRAWAERCVKVLVRIDANFNVDLRMDNDVRVATGVARDGSLLN
jgi:hypothetical protein